MFSKINIYLQLTLILLTINHVGLAQNTNSGIYLKAVDFSQQKLAYASPDTKIKPHEVFKKATVEVKYGDTIVSLCKADIFGYRDQDGCSYRFFKGNVYPIINSNGQILFYQLKDAPVQKGQTPTYSYFFSKDCFSTILPLTITNIELEFKNEKEFLKLLELHFSSESNLLEYDKTHQIHQLNKLLKLAKNEKS